MNWSNSNRVIPRTGDYHETTHLRRCIGCGCIGIVMVGGECRLRNPWPDTAITLYRSGKKAEGLEGALLRFPTERGETITAVPRGSTPPRKKVP